MVGDGEWLTTGEMSKALNVHEDTARAWADAGKVTVKGVEYPLTVTRMPGGHRRIKSADVTKIRDAIYGGGDSGPAPDEQDQTGE